MNEAQIEKYLEKLQGMQSQYIDPQPSVPVEEQLLQYLVFGLSGEEYAVPILAVKSVIALPKVTRVPYMPTYYRGVINMRGQIVSVLDVKAMLRLPSQEESSEYSLGSEVSVVIFDRGTHCQGIIVDSVNRMLYVKDPEGVRPVKLLDIDHVMNGEKL